MPIQPALRERIQSLLDANRVVLFMKGRPNAPQCGFSAKAVGILSGLGVPWHGVDVLADAEIRDGIKVFGNWPTIPQLYIGGELVGGSDIIEQLVNSGELHQLLDLPAPDRSVPTITMTDTAAAAIGRAMADLPPGTGLHLSVDPGFNAQFALKEITGNELVAQVQGLNLYIDVISAPRANGMEIDWVERTAAGAAAQRRCPARSSRQRRPHRDRCAPGGRPYDGAIPASASGARRGQPARAGGAAQGHRTRVPVPRRQFQPAGRRAFSWSGLS